MFTFELGQTIYYIREDRIHSAPVLARMCVENEHDDWASTEAQKALFTPFGPSDVIYATCHGLISNRHAFGSRQDLIDSLI